MISACFYTYFTPPEHETIDENTAECQDEYRLYLLVSGSCLIVPTLLIAYIVLCNKWHSVDRVQELASLAILIECIMFSGIFIYFKILSTENDYCENTGTLVGSLAMVPLYVCGASCTMFGACVLSAYFYIYMQNLMRRFCCCFGGTALLGPNMPRVSYSKRDFQDEHDCSICLNEFHEGQTVSVLHCNIKHVFHIECIKAWLERNPICPLCKAEIGVSEQKKFNKAIKRLLKERREAQCPASSCKQKGFDEEVSEALLDETQSTEATEYSLRH